MKVRMKRNFPKTNSILVMNQGKVQKTFSYLFKKVPRRYFIFTERKRGPERGATYLRSQGSVMPALSQVVLS